jgi:hypothetical protein
MTPLPMVMPGYSLPPTTPFADGSAGERGGDVLVETEAEAGMRGK